MFDYTGKTIFLGLDVHKLSYSLTAMCEGAVVKRDRLEADPRLLVKYCKKYFPGGKIESAYEAGFCGFHLHRILTASDIKNIVIHPANIEVSKNDSVKTDRRDSQKIAEQLSQNRLKGIFVPSEKREDARHLTRLRDSLVKQRVRTACQIKSVLHLHGMIPHNEGFPITSKGLPLIIKMCKTPNLKYRLQTLAQTWNYFTLQIKNTNMKLTAAALINDCRLREIYCSLPGFGRTIANVLINEIGDTLQFSNEQKLFSYAGLTPREHTSGEHHRQGHITKQGKPILRKMLVQAAWRAIRVDESLAAIFNRIKGSKKGKSKIAIVAIARILLGRARTCIKENRLYVISKKKEQPSV
jgi:transposase